MSNTSGIPDYFSKQAKGKKTVDGLYNGVDEPWSLEKTLDIVRDLKPDFKPGEKGKVSYSDSNYALLGKLIETMTGMTMGQVFQEYIFDDIDDARPIRMFHKSKQVHLPQYMASIASEGGIVSTAQDSMVFLKAFFQGHFFPKEQIEALKKWKFIFFPSQFYYGQGLEKLWVPRFISPFKHIGEIIGFWGQSGAFAFYHPATDLYFTGTANQTNGSGHSAAYKAMINILKTVLK